VYSSIAEYTNNLTLAQFKAEIRQKCAPISKIIAEMRNEIETLKKDNNDLKKKTMPDLRENLMS
jgi:hypothetical protein